MKLYLVTDAEHGLRGIYSEDKVANACEHADSLKMLGVTAWIEIIFLNNNER